MARSTQWYLCSFPDRGAGVTSCRIYIEAATPKAARAIAGRLERLSTFDPMAGDVTLVGESFSDIANGLFRGGPNAAVHDDGTITQSSDIDATTPGVA